MALARKCDVCGRLYDIYYLDLDEQFKDGTYERKSGPLKVNDLRFGDSEVSCIRFDLCPGCHEEIVKTIEVKMAGKIIIPALKKNTSTHSSRLSYVTTTHTQRQRRLTKYVLIALIGKSLSAPTLPKHGRTKKPLTL